MCINPKVMTTRDHYRTYPHQGPLPAKQYCKYTKGLETGKPNRAALSATLPGSDKPHVGTRVDTKNPS